MNLDYLGKPNVIIRSFQEGGRQGEGRLNQHEKDSSSPAEAGFEGRKRGHDPGNAGGF